MQKIGYNAAHYRSAQKRDGLAAIVDQFLPTHRSQL